MNTDRFQLLSDLFERASGLAGSERAAFLDRECGEDRGLRAEIEALLAHSERPDDPVVTAAGLDALFEEAGLPSSARRSGKMPGVIGRNPLHPSPTPSPLNPERGREQREREGTGGASTGLGIGSGGAAAMPLLTGQYRILRVIGEGGMGIVYEAEQAFPKRRVALKAIRPGLFTRRMLRRFQNEAHILGRLQHPGIAQIYEAGASDPRSPDDAFFVMEFVDGPPLTAYAEQRGLRTRARVEIMIRVCEAVHHAHQRGVIHRDLKPGNILVAEDVLEDAGAAGGERSPHPKVLDFGVARVTDHATRPGEKEAREQTMLTRAGQLIGTLAYMSPEQISAGPDDVDVRSDVYALGVVLYQLLTGKLPLDLADKSIPDAVRIVREEEPPVLGTVDRAYRGDLETIVAKAMEKDRVRRYQSAADLGDDLRRYLDGEAIAAKRDSPGYILRKFVRRHTAAVTVGAMILLGLIAFGVVSSVQARRNERLASALADQLVIANTDRGHLEVLSGTPYLGERTLWAERLQHPELIGTYWALWDYYAHQPILRTTGGPGLAGRKIATTPNRAVLVRASEQGELQGWSGELDRCLWRVEPDGTGFTEVAAAPSNAVAAGVGVRGKIVLFDPRTGEVRRRIAGENDLLSVVFLPDSRTFVTGDNLGRVTERDAQTGEVVATISKGGGSALRLAMAPDASTMVIGRTGGTCSLVDMEERKTVATLGLRAGTIAKLEYSRDGTRLYAMMGDGLVHVFEAERWEELPSIDTGDQRSTMALLDDATLVTSGMSSTRVWDIASRTVVSAFPGEESGMVSLLAGPRPGTFYMCGMGTGVRLWETSTLTCARRLLGGTDAMVFSAEPSPDGAFIAGSDAKGMVRLWDARTGALVGECQAPSERVRFVTWRARTREFIAAFGTGEVGVFRADASGVAMAGSWKAHPGEACSVAITRDGRTVATGSVRDGIRLWDFETRKELGKPETGQGAVFSVDFSPDGKRLVSCGMAPGIALTEVATGRTLLAVADASQNWRARFSPDGSVIAATSVRPEIQLLDPATLTVVRTLTGHRNAVIDLHFSEDGSTLASCSHDGAVRLWNLRTGRGGVGLELGFELSWASFVPGGNGRALVVSGAKGQARLLDLSYYDKHIAGNTSYFLHRIGGTLPTAPKREELRAWMREALEEPGATLDDPTVGVRALPNGVARAGTPAVIRREGE